jgi:radical SAM protein with 4Fe4S-binding SPASM domain
MSLATIDQSLKDLSPEDLRTLAQRFAAELGRMQRPNIRKLELFVTEAGIQRTFWLGHVDVGLVAERTRQQLTDDRDVIRYKCMKCAHRNTCMGGCPATNYLCTGSPYVSPKIDCEMHAFWVRLKHERPKFWAASEIPFGPDKDYSSECVADGRRRDARPVG